MLGAFRRYAVFNALRSSARTLSARSTPQRFQWLSSQVSASPSVSRSLYHSSSVLFSEQASATAQHGAPEPTQSALPTEFRELADGGLVDPLLVKNLTAGMGLQTMTDVQRMTIPVSVKGEDVLAQAKTGTGKTVAFLVPVIQRLLNDPTLSRASFRRRGSALRAPGVIDIRALIISPTRELAEQIAAEASRMTHGTGLVVQTAVGGTQRKSKLLQLQRQGCNILVGTPGRLRDLFSDPRSLVKAPKLSALVLDEADRLMDQGFSEEINDIQDMLPDPLKVDRQTLLFSATLPGEVMGVVRRIMKPGFHFAKIVRDNEIPTHLSVPQKAVVLNGLENSLPALLELVQKGRSDDSTQRPFKAIVYFNTTRQVNLAFEVFTNLVADPADPRSGFAFGRMFMGEIHSRLTQLQRTNVSDRFRKCTSGLLFSSNVTARGMDFPDVTHVIQVGVPQSREDYIHRLGRTARANKTGEGWVLIHKEELPAFKNILGDLPVEISKTSLATQSINIPAGEDKGDIPPEASKIFAQIKDAAAQVAPYIKQDVIVSQAAAAVPHFRNRESLVAALNDLAIHGYGLDSVPELPATVRRGWNGGNSRPSRMRDNNRSNQRGRSSDFDSSRSMPRDRRRNRSHGYDGNSSRRTPSDRFSQAFYSTRKSTFD